MLYLTDRFPARFLTATLGAGVNVIIIDLGKLGRAMLHKPTALELLALAILLLALIVFFR